MYKVKLFSVSAQALLPELDKKKVLGL